MLVYLSDNFGPHDIEKKHHLYTISGERVPRCAQGRYLCTWKLSKVHLGCALLVISCLTFDICRRDYEVFARK